MPGITPEKPSPRSPLPAGRLRALALLAAVGALVALLYRRFGYPLVGIDDANIFFVYARHLADGHGFVYNIGDGPVEGVTSLLWTFMCTLGYAITDHPELLLLALNLGATTAALIVAMRLLERGGGSAPAGATAADHATGTPSARPRWLHIGQAAFLLLVLCAPDYLLWMTLTLMDLGVWSLLIVASTVVVAGGHADGHALPDGTSWARGTRVFSVLIVLMLLARPEAMLFAGVLIAVVGFGGYARAGMRGALVSVRTPLIVYAITLGGLTLFRFLYFGVPLPNTFYAKVSPSMAYNLTEGAGYLLAYIKSSGVVQVLLFVLMLSGWRAVAAAVGVINARRRGDGASFDPIHALPIVCIAGILVPVLVGGDHFGSFRFYQPFFPLLVVNLVLWLGRAVDVTVADRIRGLRVAVVLAALVLATVAPGTTWHNVKKASDLQHEFRIATDGREAGRRMTALFSGLDRYPTDAATAAGAVKLWYAGPVFDVFGLNDFEVAHAPGDRRGRKNHAAFNLDIFFARAPEMLRAGIALDNSPAATRIRAARVRWGRRVLAGLFDDERFRYHYVQVGRTGESPAIEGMFSDAFIDTLERAGGFSITEAAYGLDDDE